MNIFSWDGSKYLGELIGEIMTFLPNLISATLIIIIGILGAKLLKRIVARILSKTKIDLLSHKLNQVEFINKLNIEVKFSAIIAKFIYFFLILVIIVVATDILNIRMLSELVVSFIEFVPNIFIAFIMLVIGILVANWLKNMVFNIAKSLALPSASLLSNLVFYFVLINILISVMMQLKVNVDFLSTNLSLIIGGIMFAFALAYGLASKGILKNIISSFYYKNKYTIGEYMVIGNFEGKITDIDNFNLTLENKNDKIIIPISRLNDNEVIIKNKN